MGKSGTTSWAMLGVLLLPWAPHIGRGQWTQGTGLEMGSISCLARSATALYAGTPDQGVFRSVDSGATWTPINNGLGSRTIASLAAGSGCLLAGTYGSGVFLSSNEGESWVAASDGLSDLHIYSLAVRDTVFYAGTVNGVFESDDRGRLWELSSKGITGSTVRVLACIDSILFAGTLGAGAFFTRNPGAGWTSASSGLSNPNVQSFAACGTYLFAGTYGGLFISDNAGLAWYPVNISLSRDSPPLNAVLKDKTVFALAAHGTRLFIGSWLTGVLLTSNFGISWTTVNAGLPEVSVYAIITDGTYLIAGTYGSGIWRRPIAEMNAPSPDPGTAGPAALTLEQNYPNPFNPKTTIRYRLPAASQVSLFLYNTLGQQVAEILRRYEDAGDHEVQFDGSGLASGIYFYQLSSGTRTQTRRAVLVR
ncbi:MAG: T9SS type A sorting domain-containing protein [Bacteroidota bacterium]